MIYLELNEVLRLHELIIEASGGPKGIRDFGALESSLAQPMLEVFETELYPTLIDKAAMLGFSIITNHPFLDGNKRIGHAAMETFLLFNGYEIDAPVTEQEEIILAVASGSLDKEAFTNWVKTRTTAIKR